MDNYYQILGVPTNATQEEIRRRYFFLAKAYHPDRFTDDASKAEAQREMQKINAAYDTLSNTEKRRRYDCFLTLKTSPPGGKINFENAPT